MLLLQRIVHATNSGLTSDQNNFLDSFCLYVLFFYEERGTLLLLTSSSAAAPPRLLSSGHRAQNITNRKVFTRFTTNNSLVTKRQTGSESFMKDETEQSMVAFVPFLFSIGAVCIDGLY